MYINTTIIGQLLSFVIFVWISMKYLWPPLINVIEKRQKEINNGILFSQQAQINLQKSKLECEQILQKARIEGNQIIILANKYKKKMLYDAKIEIEKERNEMLTKIKIDTELQRNRMYEDVNKYISYLLIKSLTKFFSSDCNKKDIHHMVIDNIIKKI